MDFLRRCCAGRSIRHDREGWGAPCPSPGTHILVIRDGDKERRLWICEYHLAQMDEMGALE